MIRIGVLVLALAAPSVGSPASAAGQAQEVTPNLTGLWTVDPGVIQFHVMHRFWLLDPEVPKVLNTPTLLLGAGVADRAMVALRYASNSLLVPAEPNEWEVYGRWAPLAEGRLPLDGAVRGGWNGTAESVDGELALGGGLGPVRVQLAGRAFSAWRGGDAAMAVAGGLTWRVHRWVALAADASQLVEDDAELGWGAGVQLTIPYTPHTLSLHASNVNATTLQSSSVGIPDRRLWGFEFTIPITLSRYFGGRGPSDASDDAASAPASGARSGEPAAPSDTVVVGMDNRLRFLPDTVRIRAGQAVRWENGSDLIHTVTADASLAADPANVGLPEGAEPFDSGDMAPGAEFVRVFTVPGEYRYVCLPHEVAGMVGVVIVEE